MRNLITLLLAASAMALAFAAAPQGVLPSPATDNVRVQSTNGAEFSLSRTVYRGDVKVQAPDMYLECEALTLLQQTNKAVRATASASNGSLTNLGVQLETIIAETNVLIMARGMTAIGDRAVYTRSNETFVVTGDLVVIERSNFIFFSTNFVFNRITSSGYAVGWTATEIEVSGLSGTNAPRPGFGLGRKPDAPAKPKTDGQK